MRSVTTPTEQNPADSHALLSAVEDGDAARVSSLLAAGSRADATLRGGETPLMRAAARGHEEVARVLLDAGADVNARRADGFTPLVLAVFFGHEEVVRLLIERGADVSAQTRLGTTAESWAASRGFKRVAELLRNAEAARPRPVEESKEERVEAGMSREAVRVADTETVKVADAGALKVVEAVKSTDDLVKFSRSASGPVGVGEPTNVSVRHDGRVPAHPSANAFRLGGFLRSWQGSVGTALLLTAVGVAVFAIWGGNRTRLENTRPAQAVQSPTPQTLAPEASIAVMQPSPLPSPTPDAQSGLPPEAMYPAPNTSAQPFYIPPSATNAPSVPAVISESGEPTTEDTARSRRRADTPTNDTVSRPPAADNRDDSRADDNTRGGATSRNTRVPVAESQPAPPPAARPSPAPAVTPERRKVIQWPPQ